MLRFMWWTLPLTLLPVPLLAQAPFDAAVARIIEQTLTVNGAAVAILAAVTLDLWRSERKERESLRKLREEAGPKLLALLERIASRLDDIHDEMRGQRRPS